MYNTYYVGPYLTFKHANKECYGNSYIVGIAYAFDAYGLIGPEHNGIFVLDDTHKEVVLDRHSESIAFRTAPTTTQLDEFKRIMKMNQDEFIIFIQQNPRSRLM